MSEQADYKPMWADLGLDLAANATLVGLCSGADFATDEVEKVLPRNTCALIKSSFGFKLGKVCPYIESADMVVGENTCDGKKKAYETLGGLLKNLYVMDLPQVKSEAGKAVEDILAGVHDSVAERIASQAGRLGLEDEVALAGGGALNPGLCVALEKRLGRRIFVAPDPQRVVALGAALMALRGKKA